MPEHIEDMWQVKPSSNVKITLENYNKVTVKQSFKKV